MGAAAWLRAVRECLGETIVFALDTALMCQGNFGGRSDEYLVWVYQQNGNEFIYYFNTDTQEKYMLDYNNIGNRTETFYVAVDKVIKSNFLSKIDSKISNMNKWNSYLSNT